ncbi:hypothetical protein D7Z54_17455 [Salibacterium salarium]|uniref:CNNM transmembrane domain-containing protein n=1 Tax=Salibacterium salarium TaxID=284579 RepID=A0A428N108_9BACI|nr:hypothetical protein [Salibacterium salarium]RSL31989.1 hypothetical protein D7Z54_17455 [Salibacterium salarium]
MNNIWKESIRWSILIAVITLVLAAIFSIISTAFLSGVGWAIGMLVVLFIVLTGVSFDMVGVAATAASEKPFHAMASKKITGSFQAMLITRNADKVANFCADVIGDISGVVSGTAASAVVLQLTISAGGNDGSTLQFVLNVIFTAVVAALTVGGKALGKTLAINHSTTIIFQVGRFFYVLENKLKITIFRKKQNKKSNKV